MDAQNDPNAKLLSKRPTANASADDRIILRLRPIGQMALNGLSSSYDPSFPAELEGVVPKHVYERDMERFNHRLTDYWPCPCCFGFGYACFICTLGLSWYFPSTCVSSAEKFAKQYFEEQANSRLEYYDIGLKFELKRSCCDSWVEVSFQPPRSARAISHYENGVSKGTDIEDVAR